ncbi:hypothetical protein [Bacillus sp. JCM 19041]|uniref:hypothetical protein n=1 Tax=Bacillus sp. JCM 19041 TaxID=1460637 RepID=UPI0006D2B48F
MMNKTFATIESRFEKRLQRATKEEKEEMEHALDLFKKTILLTERKGEGRCPIWKGRPFRDSMLN